MQDRQPGAPGQYKAIISDAELQKMQSGEQFVITMTRDDQPLVEGTPYNKASVLPDELAAMICPDVLDPTPADALRALYEGGGKAKAGFIYPLAGAVIPDGFLLCDGAAYSRTEYPELFAAIGTMYGSGDGSTTFNVPDLRNRVPAGSSENHPAGEMVGEETHKLTIEEIPQHTPTTRYGIDNDNVGMAVTVRSSGDYILMLDPIGGDQPHNNMQPTTYIRGYIIATGKGAGVSVSDIIMGTQALPLEMKYGGLGATDPKTARENLEITPENIGALSMELLWENASPTSEFAAQDVAVDLQEGSFYAIEWLYHGTSTTRSIQIACVGISTMIFASDSGRVVRRNVVFDPSKLTFSTVEGTVISSAPSTVTDNRYLIPAKIYIIKGASA